VNPRLLDKWWLAYISIASLRFHPRNVSLIDHDKGDREAMKAIVAKELGFALAIADLMFAEYTKRDAQSYRDVRE